METTDVELVHRLAGEIGVRLSGEEAARSAADLIANSFRALGLAVETQEFQYVGWKPITRPTLELLRPVTESIEVAPISHSTSTPPGGLVGRVRKAGIYYMVPNELEWPRYAVVDTEGRERAYIIGHVGLGTLIGRAIPVSNPEPLFPFPIVMIGQRDHERLSQWLNEGAEVRVRLHNTAQVLPDRTGRNVVATLAGEGGGTLVFCAHYDTAPWCPGAVDNASGVQAMYDLARRLVAEPHPRSCRFIAFDANLMHFLGSRYYVNELQARGKLGEVRAAINLDTVGAGDTFILPAWPNEMSQTVAAIAREVCEPAGYHIQVPGPLAGSDHWSFREKGVAMAEVMCWPFDGYHREEDTAERVEWKALQTATELGYRLSKML